MKKEANALFPELHPHRYGGSPRGRTLFLPRKLDEESKDERLRGAAQERAYQIILKWADLEAGGKLREQKETAIEGEFLKEVFGEALGYRMFSDNEERIEVK